MSYIIPKSSQSIKCLVVEYCFDLSSDSLSAVVQKVIMTLLLKKIVENRNSVEASEFHIFFPIEEVNLDSLHSIDNWSAFSQWS